jgi:hypothetical protein
MVLKSINPDLMYEWPVWRLVIAGKATLHELETTWSLEDLMKANTVLDIQDEIGRLQMEVVK